MHRLLLIMALAGLISACSSTPADTTGTDTDKVTASNSEVTESEKKRCRRDTSTGSRLGTKRVCDY